MRLSQLVIRNVSRAPARALSTAMTVAIMIAAFIFPQALVDAQQEQLRQTPNNRIVTHPKLGWSGALPATYLEEILQVPGVKYATTYTWPAFRLPGKEGVHFDAMAVNQRAFVDMHHELVMPDEQREAFAGNDRGALVSRQLADELGWKLGDRLVFESNTMKGTWELEVVGIFKSDRAGYAERSVWVAWPYLNRTLPEERRDRVNFISAEIFAPNEGGRIARAIDSHFAARPAQTLSLEDQVLAAAYLGRFQAILSALHIVSYLILAVVAAILGNTLAMNVRERTREFGVMRAIGFQSWHLLVLVLGEALLIGLGGAAIGLCISYPLLEGVVTRVLRDAMSFPPVEIPHRVAALSLALGLVLALIAGGPPALRIARMRVTESLGRVG